MLSNSGRHSRLRDVYHMVNSMAWRRLLVDSSVLSRRTAPGPLTCEWSCSKQHAVIGDVLDALADLDDLAENKLELFAIVACRIDDDDSALIEAILDDGDALDQALRRARPAFDWSFMRWSMSKIPGAKCSRACLPATSEDLTARGSSEDLEASIDPDQRCVSFAFCGL